MLSTVFLTIFLKQPAFLNQLIILIKFYIIYTGRIMYAKIFAMNAGVIRISKIKSSN